MAKKATTRAPRVSQDDAAGAPAPESRINKSEEIRVEARKLLDAGATPSPKRIIGDLAARGIDVVSPQVSQVLKKMGVARRTRGSAKTPGRDAMPVVAVGSSEAFTLHELIAAKKFVEMVGGAARAASLLDAIGRIS